MASTITAPSPPMISSKPQTNYPIKLAIQSATIPTKLSSIGGAIPCGLSLRKQQATRDMIEARHCPLASMWRKIQGVDDWCELMEPLHPVLRDEIVRYGEFVTACYKAFDMDPNSKRYLNCKYSKDRMFHEIGMPQCGYEVTKYIYATPNINIPTQSGTCRSRWIGYIAVANDKTVQKLGRRDIVVTFRGTVTNPEWIANFMSSLTPANLDPHDPRPNVKVESGFLSLYTSDDTSCKFSQGSCREQLLKELSRLINKYKDEELSITLAGHSMGSALALLFAYDVAELGVNKFRLRREIPITVHSFGGPRVGNLGFKERCDELGLKVLRVANVKDPITKLPGVLLNENFRTFFGGLAWSDLNCYAHVGVELALDFFKVQDPTSVHDLQAYLGLLKCPTSNKEGNFGTKEKKIRVDDIVSRAMKLILRKTKFEAWPWHDTARQVGALVQCMGFI